MIWKYEPKQDPDTIPVMCCDTVNRGAAYGDGKIFLHQADTTLVALDAKTGQVVWSVVDGDPKKGETGTSAPMVIKDKVLVGISGGEFGVPAASPPTASRTARRSGPAFRAVRTISPCWIRRRPPCSASRSARTPAPPPGRAISGRSAAARPGAGCPTTRTSTWSTTAPAIPRPGTRCNAPVTIAGR